MSSAFSNKVGVYDYTQSRKSNDGQDDGKRVDTDQTLEQDYGQGWSYSPEHQQILPFVQTNVCGPSLHLLLGLLHSASLATGSHRKLNRNSDLAICHMIERAFLASGPHLLSLGCLTGFAASQCMDLEEIHWQTGPPRSALAHQLKCACCSTKTKHKYCKWNVDICGRCFIMFHTKWTTM